jgi:hypothetical protein
MSGSGDLLHASIRVCVQAQRRANEAAKIASPGSAEACGSVIRGPTILAVVPAWDGSKVFRVAGLGGCRQTSDLIGGGP